MAPVFPSIPCKQIQQIIQQICSKSILSGNLTQWNIGGLNVHSIKRGESTIMKSIPSWPKGIPRKELDSFEMPILLKAIGELMAN